MSQESLLGPYLKPGTPIKVGSYSTKIIRYLSEGGFSHVYIARLDIPVRGSDVAVLKRIVAPDKVALSAIRTEVDTMKRLKGHRYIVTYIDSHASALKHGGYEVYVLMEYCPGGGLIDFMNTRLQTRLAEWEVLKIISDTTEAVACMHYLRPPLLHRDLKIENVLISGNGDYKLCDFGSCTEPKPPATNSKERRDLEDDIQKNTTIQYRSPEMVDVARKLPIDEKSDIWALGVLLYKLCYFTTPFEAQGPLAILNAAYTFPPYPPYTDRTKRLIAVTLQENPRDRPNIYQLLAEICAMRNVAVPIPDIYSKSRSASSGRPARSSSRADLSASTGEDVIAFEKAPIGADISTAAQTTPLDIAPMRRGRPQRVRSSAEDEIRNDAFQQSDRNVSTQRADSRVVEDEAEFTVKFPSLEEMDLALAAPVSTSTSTSAPESRGITRLSEEPIVEPATLPSTSLRTSSDASRSRPLPIPPSSLEESSPEEFPLKPSEIAKAGNFVRGQSKAMAQDERQNPVAGQEEGRGSNFAQGQAKLPVVRPKPIQLESRAPDDRNPYHVEIPITVRSQGRPGMVSRSSQTSPKSRQAMQTQTSPPKKQSGHEGLDVPKISQNLTRDASGIIVPRHRETSMPSHDAKPSFRFTTSLDRPRGSPVPQDIATQNAGTRPKTIHVENNLEFLRDLDSPLTSTTHTGSIEVNKSGNSIRSDRSGRYGALSSGHNSVRKSSEDASNIRRSVSVSAGTRHNKRPSLSNVPSFSGAARNIMNGKFGDAFKRFESSNKHKGSTPTNEMSNPLRVAEDDLPEHITQHLQSAEARRSSSYSRSRPSLEKVHSSTYDSTRHDRTESIESSTTSVKEAMRRLKEKANQTYVPTRSAQGYGRFTEPEAPHRAATVIPYARPPHEQKPIVTTKPEQLHSKNSRRYALQDDDNEQSFSRKYPPLNDFKV